MPTKKISERDLSINTYRLTTTSKASIVGLGFILLLCGFIFHFPVKTIIINSIQAALDKSKTCRVSHSGIELGYFLPKVIINKPTISGLCTRKLGGNVNLADLNIVLLRPTFSPLGIKLKTETKWMEEEIVAYVIASLSKQIIRIDDLQLDISQFKNLHPMAGKLKGEVRINSYIEMEKQKLANLSVLIESENFHINPISYLGLNIPTTQIGKVLIKGETDKNRFLVDEIALGGNKNSALTAKFTGDITLTPGAIQRSRVNLRGEFKVSEQLTTQIPILNMFLSSLKKDKDFYQIAIGGTLQAPKPLPL